MKTLKRDENGNLFLEEEKTRSPIVTETNFPTQLRKPAQKTEPNFQHFTEEQLLAEMAKLGGENLVTEQFAVFLAPKVKSSVDADAHRLWDLSQQHIRSMMRSLENKGLVVVSKKVTKGKTRYFYHLKK